MRQLKMVIFGMSCCASVLFLSYSEAMACTCPVGDDRKSARRAEEVFYGKVESFEMSTPKVWVAKVKVRNPYKGKGAKDDVLSIYTPKDSASCGVDFRVGRTFLIFASRDGKKRLTTSSCDMSRKLKKAPLFPGMDSMVAHPAGTGSIGERTARATLVFVGKVVRTGRPFAGSWHNTELTVKVSKTFKGAVRGKVKVKIDEHACFKKPSLLSIKKEGGAPIKRGVSYLFFTYDEEPTFATPCHDNILPTTKAKDVLAMLKKLCAKKGCESAGEQLATKARRRVKAQTYATAEAAFSTCAKRLPIFKTKAYIAHVVWDMEVSPKGTLVTRNLNVQGELPAQDLFDKAIQCFVKESSMKKLTPFGGDAVLAKFEFFLKVKKNKPIISDLNMSLVLTP